MPRVREYLPNACQCCSFLRFSCCGLCPLLGLRQVAPITVGGAGSGKSVFSGALQPDLPGAAAGGDGGLYCWGGIRAVAGTGGSSSAAGNLARFESFPDDGPQAGSAFDRRSACMALSIEPVLLLFSVAYIHNGPLLRRDAADARLHGLPGVGIVLPVDDGWTNSAYPQATGAVFQALCP